MASTPPNPPSQAEKRETLQQDALLREVDEAVRQDQFAQAAKKYGVLAGIVAVLGLAAFGGWLWWTEHQEAQLEATSETLVMAIEDITQGQPDSADGALALLAENGEGGARIVALLTRAGIAVERNRLEEAAKLYAQVAADEAAPPLYRDLATIREVSLRYDDLQPGEVEARLKPLAVPGAPWFGSAGELLGHAYLDQGKDEQAGALFRTIAIDEDVPQSVRFRVRQMAGSMGVDAIEDVEETLDEMSDAVGPQSAP